MQKKILKEQWPSLGDECNSSEDMELGLCYPKCRAGYNGMGPVCRKEAPLIDGIQWENCGMGAASSPLECGLVITEQVMSPLMVALNVLTFGIGGAVAKALQGIQKGATATHAVVKLSHEAFRIADAIKNKERTKFHDLINYEKAVVTFLQPTSLSKSNSLTPIANA